MCFSSQEEYNNLYKWMNHKWDFIVMQAKEQYRWVTHALLKLLENIYDLLWNNPRMGLIY